VWLAGRAAPTVSYSRPFAAPVPERLRLEFLIGAQAALHGELKFNAWGELTRLASRLARMDVGSVLDLDDSPIRTTEAELLFKRIQWSVEQALLDPGVELSRDVWRLGLLRPDGGRTDRGLPHGRAVAKDGGGDAREALVALLPADEPLELRCERVRRGRQVLPE